MTAPSAPPVAQGLAATLRLHLRRLVRGRKVRVAAIALAMVWLAVIGAAIAGDADPHTVASEGTSWGFFSLLALVWPFVLHAGAIAEEVETGTFVLVASRPVGRAALTLGKYLAGLVPAVALGIGGLVIVYAAAHLFAPGTWTSALPSLLRAAGALTLLLAFYGALCLFWGALIPEAAGIVSVLHLALLELGITWAPGVFRLLSVNYHARQLAGLPKRNLFEGMGPAAERLLPPDVSAPTAVGVLVGATLVALGLAVLVVQSSEYRYARA